MRNHVRKLQPELSSLSEGMTFLEEALDSCGLPPRQKTKTLLLSEEYLVELIQNTVADQPVRIMVRKFFGRTTVHMTSRGSSPITGETLDTGVDLHAYDDSPNAEAAIRNMILRANSDVIRLSCRNGINKAVITAGESAQKSLIQVLTAMAAAIVICLLMRLFLPESFYTAVNDYVLASMKTLFLNALKMVVAPLIFFSIAGSVSSISDLRELGKMGGRIMLFYLSTTFLAVAVSFAVFCGLQPGQPGGMTAAVTEAAAMSETASVSILDTLLSIVPSNFFGAFVDSNTLQLIFLAVLIGVAVPQLGKRSAAVAGFLAAGDELFLHVAQMITKCLPAAVFAFIGSMVLTTEIQTLKSLLSLLLCILAGYAVIVALYLLIVLIMTRSTPLFFLKRAFPAWLNAFALSSSNAAIVNTMHVCDRNLRISPKLYSFSIPLGATVNMDGGTITVLTSLLFFAKLYGVTFTPGDLVALCLTVVLLSFGCPGIPGASVVIVSVLLNQFGIPADALGLFIGVVAILDPFSTANNVLGDAVGTYCVARRLGMMQQDP